MTREIMKIMTHENMKNKIPRDLANGHLVLHISFKQEKMLQTDVKLFQRPPIGPPPAHVHPLEFDCLTALQVNLSEG